MNARHPSDEEDGRRPLETERRHRDQLAESLAADPHRFVSADAAADAADPAIRPWTGDVCVLVPRDSPARFWEDHRLRIGVCDYFPAEDEEAEPDPARCPYKVVSVLAAPTEKLLLAGALLAAQRNYPELSRTAIVADLRRRFRVVRIGMQAVRIAVLMDDSALVGGEPWLRWQGSHPSFQRDVRDPGWARMRETLERWAAGAAVPADAGWQHAAYRLLIWIQPFAELVELDVIRVHEDVPRERGLRLLALRDLRGQLLLPQLLGRSPERRGGITRRSWRLLRLSRRALRRRRRAIRTGARSRALALLGWVGELAREEFGWRETDLDRREHKRNIAFKTLRRFGALIAAPVLVITTPLLRSSGEVLRWMQRLIF